MTSGVCKPKTRREQIPYPSETEKCPESGKIHSKDGPETKIGDSANKGRQEIMYDDLVKVGKTRACAGTPLLEVHPGGTKANSQRNGECCSKQRWGKLNQHRKPRPLASVWIRRRSIETSAGEFSYPPQTKARPPDIRRGQSMDESVPIETHAHKRQGGRCIG